MTSAALRLVAEWYQSHRDLSVPWRALARSAGLALLPAGTGEGVVTAVEAALERLASHRLPSLPKRWSGR